MLCGLFFSKLLDSSHLIPFCVRQLLLPPKSKNPQERRENVQRARKLHFASLWNIWTTSCVSCPCWNQRVGLIIPWIYIARLPPSLTYAKKRREWSAHTFTLLATIAQTSSSSYVYVVAACVRAYLQVVVCRYWPILGRQWSWNYCSFIWHCDELASCSIYTSELANLSLWGAEVSVAQQGIILY